MLLLPTILFSFFIAAPTCPAPRKCAPPPLSIGPAKPELCTFDPTSEQRCCFYPIKRVDGNGNQLDCVMVACQISCDLPWEPEGQSCQKANTKRDA